MAAGNRTDPLVTEAYLLARDYIAYVTGRNKGPAPSPTCLALRQAGDELLEKFPIFFKRWPRVFKGVTKDRVCDFLIETIDENLRGYWDRQRRHPGYPADIPWSTVLSIYVLAGQMAVYCQEQDMETVLEPLSNRLGAYVEEHICPVLRQEGWVGFTEHYGKKEDIERKTLRICCAALVVCSVLLFMHFLWRKKLSSLSTPLYSISRKF